MSRATAFAVAMFLLSGAAGAQPRAARGSVPLPVSVRTFAAALGLPSSDAATVLVHVVRLAFGAPDARGPQRRRVQDALQRALTGPRETTTDVVPLPLDPSIWRDTILQAQVRDNQLVSAILMDRTAALLYLGLAALDDETLGWLGPERDTLLHLRKHPAIFAAFGRSVHVRAGRVVVPGGAEAEPLWRSVTGTGPDTPGAFVQRVFSGDGRLAFLYDTIAHLDEPHQRFALGLYLPAPSRDDRLRALLDAFAAAAPDWRADERPFSKPPIDGAMLLSTVAVTPRGSGAPSMARRIWERVFRADTLTDVLFKEVSPAEFPQMSPHLSVDAAWLATRILRVPYALGRRRLDTLLFAQRVFGGQPAWDPAPVATALRGYAAFPALMISLERSGITEPATFARAARHAAKLNAIESIPLRRTSIAEFQSALVFIERARRSGVLDVARADVLVDALCSLDVSSRTGYGERFSAWLRDGLIGTLAPTERRSAEETVLAALAGVSRQRGAAPVVEWEGRSYRVDPAAAELRRLRLVRERQGGLSLDEALSAALGRERDDGRPEGAAPEAERTLADTLTTIVYAVYLGDPEGVAVTSGNVALRHDFGLVAVPAISASAWRLPIEDFDRRAAWRIRGSIFGLETALGRLALRRLNPAQMPGEPTLGPQDRQTVMLTAALLNPLAMSDEARDDIAAAIARGRAHAAALSPDPTQLDAVARDAGLSEWRRQALGWALGRNGGQLASRFSLLELFWLGSPRQAALRALDAWGAAALPLTGCLCLDMPRARPWEEDAGRASAVLGTRGADVVLRIAETLASLKLPASLAPALAGYAVQDVLEHARLSNPDDWDEFGRAARELPPERMFDYIAALTAGGPLVATGEGKR